MDSVYVGNYHQPPTDYPQYQPSKVPQASESAHVPNVQYGYNQAPNFSANQAVAGMAMQYSSAFMGQGADFVQKNKWSTQFDPSGPVPPGDDLNAPDLYIPLMAFITYVLASGAIMGFQGRFTPEQLGILSSEALGWLVLEVLIFLLCVYVLNIQSNISYLDLIAFSGYKFVSMIAILVAYLVLDKTGYYFSLIYTSLALAFLLIRTLKLKVLPHAEAYPSECNKRRVYLLLVIAVVQPFVMWWLTRRLLISLPAGQQFA